MKAGVILPLLAGLWTCAAAREVTLEAQPFAVRLELEALVVPGDAQLLAIAPQSGAPWEVQSVLAHGTAVKRGEALLRIETRDLDAELEKQRLDAKQRKLAFEKASKELEALEISVPADLAAIERKAARASQDLDYFTKVARPASQAEAKQSVIVYEQRVESVREELRQLEAMYKADDLTEDTEEIILKRQRDEVKNGEFNLEQVKRKAQQALETELPRQAEDLLEAQRRSSQELAQARESLPRGLELKRQELAKMKLANAEADHALAQLEADRQAMEFKATSDGVLYYGEFANGSWNGAEATKLLVPGAKLPAHRVFATLVPNTSKPRLAARLTEAQAGTLTTKTKGSASTPSQPQAPFPVSVRTLATIPDGEGRYLLELDAELPAEVRVVPGMAAKVVLQPYQSEKALLVPKEAITRDSSGVARVALRLADGKLEQREVRPGREHNGNVEILKGLEAGQVIVIGNEEKPS